MKLIKSSYEILPQLDSTIENIYRQIELAGRVCYKSEDRINDYSAKKFVDRLIDSGHHSVLEHGTVYLTYTQDKMDDQFVYNSIYSRYANNKYSAANLICDHEKATAYITTNYRTILENGWAEDLYYISEPTADHELRLSVRFICDRAIMTEFLRHRVFSFSCESTRYCNYSKKKFGNEITVIVPSFFADYAENSELFSEKDSEEGEMSEEFLEWAKSCEFAEKSYFKLLEMKRTPQEARTVLPQSLKTELVMTGFLKDWGQFFELRDSDAAHPQAKELASKLNEEFDKLFYSEQIINNEDFS